MKKNRLILLPALIFFISMINVYAQYPCFRIYPSGNFQIEPLISRHPSNPLIMFASSYNVIPQTSFRSEGVYVTTDGGQTWRGNDSCTGTPIQNHAGDPGPIIDKDGRFILTHLGAFPPGMYGNYSTNNGLNWSNNYTIVTSDNDKGSPGTDDVPVSPYYGRTYLAWTRYSSPFPVVFSLTSNGGVSWTPFQQINSSIGGHQSLGASIVVGPTGAIYIAWASVRTEFPYIEDYLGFGVSSNGGANWNIKETAIDINGIKATTLPPWGIRVNSYPGIDADKTAGPRSGWIYMVTTEKNHSPAGSDPDVILYRSTNAGANWSSGIRVNQDAINNGKVQYFPAIRVDEGGGVNIVYYDNRNVTTNDSVEVYISRSVDGGNTWNDYLISNHRFKPQSITGAGTGNQGDNIGMTSGNGKLWPVWMDNSSGGYQIWTASVDINTIGIKNISSNVPEAFSLKQNYPNPFNPSTKIKFDIPNSPFEGRRSATEEGKGDVKLIVYNILGKEITILVNQQLKPGTYEVDWNGTNFSSGVYFYKIISRDYTETKRMMLLK
jgi:hypothetical protein